MEPHREPWDKDRLSDLNLPQVSHEPISVRQRENIGEDFDLGSPGYVWFFLVTKKFFEMDIIRFLDDGDEMLMAGFTTSQLNLVGCW